jgi:hypothetical protein
MGRNGLSVHHRLLSGASHPQAGGHENDYIPSPNEAHDLAQPKDQVKTAEAAEDFFDGETVHNWLDDAPSDDEVGEEQQEDDEGDTLNSPDPAPAPNVIEVLYDSDGLYYRARVHKSWQLKTTREWRAAPRCTDAMCLTLWGSAVDAGLSRRHV